jgi:hypothetical protein
MKYSLLRPTALAALVLLATACSKTEDATPAVDNSNDNMLMGNPSGAVASTTSPTNYLLIKPQYSVGYNRDQGKPIWVTWHLGSADLGSAARQDDFRSDTDLPSGWYQVKASDYVSSGFDRGHNCPSADRTATVADNSATFLMSNMMPQAPNNNQQKRTIHRVRQLRPGRHWQRGLPNHHRGWQGHGTLELLEGGGSAAGGQQRRKPRHEQHPHYCHQHSQQQQPQLGLGRLSHYRRCY